MRPSKPFPTVTIVDADCAPGEIRAAFSKMVSSLIQRDDAESALNLLERLSEIERFQRMAPMIMAQISPPERDGLLEIFPRLMTLLHLKEELNRAKNGEKHHLTERIEQEKTLLAQAIEKNPNPENLPALLTRSDALRERLLFLLGLCFEMDRVADLAVANAPGNEENPDKEQYRKLMALYGKTLKGIKHLATREKTPGVAALFRSVSGGGYGSHGKPSQ